jgi:hypothetical protein
VLQRDAFDVAIETPDQCPFYLPVYEYLNRPEVLASLGVPVNWTYDSNMITSLYGFPSDWPFPINGTGDAFRQAGLPELEYLLGEGVKVALVYGDRDYRCPWTGGETTAKAAQWEHQTGFLAAGYERIQGLGEKSESTSLNVSTTDTGGVVKQYGQLSFSRIFNAGHSVNAYAPETVFRIFNRTMFGHDVVSGVVAANATDYHTTGPTDSWGWRNTLPPLIQDTCMVEGKFLPVNPWTALLAQ